MSELCFVPLLSRQIEPYLNIIGDLRIRVFKEYPYLYEGTLEEERYYLKTYMDSPSSLIVLAMVDSHVVGATSCVRMSEGEPAFQACFLAAGYQTPNICYFGESVLLPEFRGRGIGKAFFQHREAHARELGCLKTTFCAVDRPSDHPLRPPGYRPLDSFWEAQGYTRHPELQATFVWKEIHEAQESPKTLTYWTKDLA